MNMEINNTLLLPLGHISNTGLVDEIYTGVTRLTKFSMAHENPRVLAFHAPRMLI